LIFFNGIFLFILKFTIGCKIKPIQISEVLMKIKKIDLMVDAVRYTANGQIEFVRGFEKRGAAFSDNIIVSRDALIVLLKNGKTVVSGDRKAYLGTTFDIQSQFKLVGEFVTNQAAANSDTLVNVPQL
jgi:hypothetical protein